MKGVTPPRLTSDVMALCRSIAGEDAQPVYVSIVPEADAGANDCFPTVARKVARDGGQMVCGWRIREVPRVFVEAEFHSVWQSPDEGLIDVGTVGDYKRTLFMPYPQRSYDGRQVDNVRRAVFKHPAVLDLFRAARDEFNLMNRGERAGQCGLLLLSDGEQEELVRIHLRKAQAMATIEAALPPLGRNDPCTCGSGRKHKQCCGA